MNELIERLDRAAGHRSGGVLVLAQGGQAYSSWSDLAEEACVLAGKLRSLGVKPGSRVGVLAGTCLELLALLQALWRCGATVTVLPPPGRASHPDLWQGRLKGALAPSPLEFLIVGPPLEAFAEATMRLSARVLKFSQLSDQPVVSVRGDNSVGAELPLIQLTSGSTGNARGVRIAVTNLIANLDDVVVRTKHSPDSDVMVSWLPLYHDMGLIGHFLLPMSSGCRLVLLDPSMFAARPRTWWETVSRLEGTATAAPNFAYGVAAKSLSSGGGLDLSRVRFSLCGGEQIDNSTVEAFLMRAASFGFPPSSLVPAYGMAEATLAVSIGSLGEGVKFEAGLEGGERAALLGAPLSSVRVRICQSGPEVRSDEAGEILLKGDSVSNGYSDDRANEELFVDGWLRTGDVGRLRNGELQMLGRTKEIVIVAGVNISPVDAERAAATVQGVRPGRVVAYPDLNARGREELSIAIELGAGDERALDLIRAVKEAVYNAIGINPRNVVIAEGGTIPKTPSGKLQRLEAAKLFSTP